MRSHSITKRELLQWTGGVSVGLLTGGAAQSGDSLFGVKLPREVMALVPQKPQRLARIAQELVRLESLAKVKRLPASVLDVDKGLPIAELLTGDLDGSLYENALPRLVALIDRSERRDPAFANQAGSLLAELHPDQHEVPETLRLSSDTSGGFGLPTLGDLRGDEADDGAPPPAPPAPPLALPSLGLPVPKPAAPPPLSRRRDYASLRPEYLRLFSEFTLLPEKNDRANWHLTMMRNAKARYEDVGGKVAVPWYFIAAIHALEASFNFRAHLHNGDYPLTARTRQVPAGRPLTWLPPADWESSAKDALKLLGFANQSDWSLERTLYRLEAYNGFGYRKLGVASPYLWSYSTHYTGGKFVSDGTFNAKARSQQCGAAVMLKLLADAGDITLSPAT